MTLTPMTAPAAWRQDVRRLWTAAVVLLMGVGGLADRAEAAEGTISFARDIRPILSNQCFMCHGPDEAERKGGPTGSGGLRLDTAEGAATDLGGGKRSVVAGRPDLSDLIARVTTTDPDDVMPPPKSGKKLTSEEVDLLTRWVEQGAPYSRHWSYEPPVRVAPPLADIHAVDAFVLDRLVKEGMTPQPPADRWSLARRAALDLTGLPPTPEELENFVSDPDPAAYDRFIDRLLASPAYGEHWARSWLDLARYADSAGYADDPPRTIWGYRDYVIRSFNENKPFDQFTIEQLAGDLMPAPTEDQLIATAFHRNTMTNSEGGTDDEEFRSAAIVDRVNTTLATWMGTSMACAQCHTHKYDPITHHEYFQVYAIFNNTADADQRDEAPLLSFFTEEQKARRRAVEKALAEVEAKFTRPTPALQAAAESWASAFPLSATWEPVVPTAARSQSGNSLTVATDGTVTAAGGAAKDTYELEVAVAATRTVTAVRLQALPDPSLPGNGPGHAEGNFVLTAAKASVQPPAGTPGPVARFIRIELPGTGRLLQLAEVEVFSGGANAAPGGTATQKSTFAGAGAARAIDGNTDGAYANGSVAHTGENAPDPWWEVDLQAERSIERIVVWNRLEVAERLDGFRVVALDAQRRPIWERAGNPAARESNFTLDGARDLSFDDAVAEYLQKDFDEDAVVRPPAGPAKPGDRQRGWAVGGAPGRAHSLTLLLGTPVEVPAGSVIRLRLEHQSPFDHHTIGKLRIELSGDPAVGNLRGLPPPVAAALAQPASQRNAESRSLLTTHYLESVAPELQDARATRADLQARLAAIPPSTVPVFRERPADQRRTTQVHLRGNRLTPGDVVTEGVPSAWHPLPADTPINRLVFARWLMDEKNPLTARVLANRYWEALFGVGLVRTSEEFGAQGELPSHPELLDWLATELVRLQWDMKAFLRLLVTSQTYQQSSRVEPGAAERDPENRLLARGPRIRLSAEMLRDQALAVSGLLSRTMYGPSVRPVRPALGLSAAFGGGLDWQPSAGADRFRRGLYTEWRRTSPYPSMTTFDAPNREVCTLRRSQTNTPLQALVTLNDPVFIEAAQALARRLMARGEEPESMIREGFRLVLARPPSATETGRLIALHREMLGDYQRQGDKAVAMATVPIGPLPAGVDAAEAAAWTAVASVLLNLDETLMKR